MIWFKTGRQALTVRIRTWSGGNNLFCNVYPGEPPGNDSWAGWQMMALYHGGVTEDLCNWFTLETISQE